MALMIRTLALAATAEQTAADPFSLVQRLQVPIDAEISGLDPKRRGYTVRIGAFPGETAGEIQGKITKRIEELEAGTYPGPPYLYEECEEYDKCRAALKTKE